jgi:hypothetical protein
MPCDILYHSWDHSRETAANLGRRTVVSRRTAPRPGQVLRPAGVAFLALVTELRQALQPV